MFYTFPTINTIDDVLPAIKDRQEFIVAEREHYTVINYAVVMPDTFPPVITKEDAIRRECRGLIFDKQGKLISRPLHKFFNIGEREETLPNNIDLSLPHMVLDKLDGSMVRPVRIDGELRWFTKMGESEVALQAEVFVKPKSALEHFAWALTEKHTPIFEWCSPNNRIVVPYDKEQLTLIAVRDNISGRYLDLHDVVDGWDIPIVQQYEQIGDITDFLERVRKEEGNEGYVIRWASGHMTKIKTDQYLTMHHSKELIQSERKIIQAILDESIDDLKSMLMKEDLEEVAYVETQFWLHVKLNSQYYEHLYKRVYEASNGDRKEFAINISKRIPTQDVPIIFSIWSGKPVQGVVLNWVRNNLGTETKYQEFSKQFYSFFPDM